MKIKLVCVGNKLPPNDEPERKLCIGKVYEGEKCAFDTENDGSILYDGFIFYDEYGSFCALEENFITLSEYRDKQIETILNE